MADLPGEFLPFLSVSLHAKVPGYVEKVLWTEEAEWMAGSF
jgi:hypothetical protein